MIIQRQRAVCISQALREAEQRQARGEFDAALLCQRVSAIILAGGGRIDYVECVSRDTLQPLTRIDQPALLAVAAYFGKTRLIDNAYLDG